MPKRLPENIGRAVQIIRKEYGHYVQAKMIRNKYRLFEATSIYDPEAKKPKKITRYLGWLTEEGMLIPARHNDMKTRVFNEIAKSNEQKIKELEESLKNAEKRAFENGVRKRKTAKHEIDILRALSMNARITTPELTKITGLSKTAMNYHLGNLEKRYDIKYLLEIDIEKFGYINYIAFLKFKDKKPDYEEMKSQLEKIPHVQAAMITKGTYDAVIFLVVKATSEARFAFYKIMNMVFPEYEVDWSITPAYPTFGFIPLRDKFFEVLKEKVWTRTKERPRPMPDEITEAEYNILRAMNSNACADFTSIDKEINGNIGRSNYAYHQLTKRGIIKRATISLHKTQAKYDVIFIMHYTVQKDFSHTSDKILLNIIHEEKQQFDTYSFTCDITSPAGILLISSITREEGIELQEQRLLGETKGIKIDTLIITNMLVGTLDNRLFDKEITRQYEILISEYKYESKNVLPKTE